MFDTLLEQSERDKLKTDEEREKEAKEKEEKEKEEKETEDKMDGDGRNRNYKTYFTITDSTVQKAV